MVLAVGEGGIDFGCGIPGVSDETRQQDISARAEAVQRDRAEAEEAESCLGQQR